MQNSCNMKKKWWKIFLAVCISVLLLLVLLFLQKMHNYQLNIDGTAVDSISLYYDNINKKVEITEINDICAVIGKIRSMSNWGNYYSLPDGGQLYCIVFHLKNLPDFTCLYLETGEGSGFFTDGTVKIKVAGIDFKELWNSLDYEIKEAYTVDEIDSKFSLIP